MPQDPRHGDHGPQRSHPQQDTQHSSGAARRRRALGDDGTGGTRVVDLLSKHGIAPGGTGSHRRRAADAEPPAPESSAGANPPRPQPPARGPQPPQNRPPRPEQSWTPPENPAPPRAGRPTRPDAKPAGPRGNAPVWAPPGSAQPNGRPPQPPQPPAPPAAGGPPTRGRDANAAPGRPPQGPPPAPPPGARHPGRPASAPAPGGDPASGEQTRIARALGGAPQPPTPPGPKPPADEDLEATTQHPRVDDSDQSAAEAKTTFARPVGRDGAEAKTTVARPVRPSEPQAKTTVVKRPDQADLEETAVVELPTEDDQSSEEADDREEEIKQIDATLARFSAVHDEIAREEEQRRKKYAWLFGKRKEPELGTDMPFDFVEGRDGISRMEWKKKQRKRRTQILVMALALAASLTVFVTMGLAWSAKSWVDGKMRPVLALDPDSEHIKDAGKQAGDQNFLLIGSDTRAGATPSDGVGTAEDEPGARADTTMVAHIPADRSRVVIVSFPRDLQVDLPACEAWDPETGQYTGEVLPPRQGARLNEAFAVGGPLCTTKVIQQISGLNITSFLGVDFQGFKSMVDALHGVEICTTTPIIDRSLGTILPEAGRYNLTGQQALSYVRARKVVGDPTSDYGRIQRQQLFLSAMLRKALSSQVLLDPGKLNDFVNAVSANTFGQNISSDKLLELGQSLQNLDAGNVTFITVPTTGYANEAGMEVLLEDETKALFQAIIDGTPISGQTAEAQQPQGTHPQWTVDQFPAQDPDPEVPDGLSTVNAGSDVCG